MAVLDILLCTYLIRFVAEHYFQSFIYFSFCGEGERNREGGRKGLEEKSAGRTT